MQLRKLTDDVLVLNTKSLVVQERKLITEILHHLREIERRRLYSVLGYSSLHAYCVSELAYSDGAAHRRISAMRLIADVPEVEILVKEGSISLTTASQIQDFLKAENRETKTVYSTEQKINFLEKAKGRSRREVEKVLISLSPKNSSLSQNQEKQRVISETETELRLVFTEEQMQKLKRFKELTSHSNPWTNDAKLIEHALDIALKKLDPNVKKEVKKQVSTAVSLTSSDMSPTSPEKRSQQVLRSPENTLQTRDYISIAIKRTVFQRAQNQCEYQDPRTNKRCDSRSFLEIDHIQPVALGGTSELDNLRCLCRNHNQLMAIQSFGNVKMQQYLKTG